MAKNKSKTKVPATYCVGSHEEFMDASGCDIYMQFDDDNKMSEKAYRSLYDDGDIGLLCEEIDLGKIDGRSFPLADLIKLRGAYKNMMENIKAPNALAIFLAQTEKLNLG